MGVLVDEAVNPKEILYYVRAMVDTFCAHGDYENRARARTRYMQDTLGPDGLKDAFLKNAAARKAEGGLDITGLEAPAGIARDNTGTVKHPGPSLRNSPASTLCSTTPLAVSCP